MKIFVRRGNNKICIAKIRSEKRVKSQRIYQKHVALLTVTWLSLGKNTKETRNQSDERQNNRRETKHGNLISIVKNWFHGTFTNLGKNGTSTDHPSPSRVSMLHIRIPSTDVFARSSNRVHNCRETASLHCRLVTTFRFFADDFFL